MPKPLKVGLIGTGDISRAHLTAYAQFPEKVQLTAVCDIREDAVREFAREAKVDAIYLDYEKILKEADVDAVDICTIHDQHAPQVIAAAEAGKHILLEKPMGITMKECREMIAATDKAGVTFMIAQMRRYAPHHQAVRRVIQEGELGTIRAARCESMVNILQMVPPPHWCYDGKRAGGGVIIGATIHQLDLLRYFVGDVSRVTAIRRTVNPEFHNGAEDYVAATLEFENGAIGEVFADFATPRAPWVRHFMIIGDDGTVFSFTPPVGKELTLERPREAMVSISSRKRSPAEEGQADWMSGFVPLEPDPEGLPSEDPFANEILHFEECCREGKEPISSGRDNLGTMKVVLGIYESIRTGKAVDLATL